VHAIFRYLFMAFLVGVHCNYLSLPWFPFILQLLRLCHCNLTMRTRTRLRWTWLSFRTAACAVGPRLGSWHPR
jgi:hypothetical protein